MTGMLASVVSPAESDIALAAGVDIIDLKNPALGVLGALAPEIVSAVVAGVDGRVPVSATVGDIAPDHPELPETIYRMAETGVDLVKVGLFDRRPCDFFLEAVTGAVGQDIKLVVVLFAEDYSGATAYEELLRAGIYGMMLDTRRKDSGNLTALLGHHTLDKFVRMAARHQLISGLAGALKYDDIGGLLEIGADYLGFRGALCAEGDRTNRLDDVKIKKIREAIPKI